MFNKLVTVFRIPELRRKILLTLILLAVYRMGFSIPLPFIDQDQLAALQAKSQGDSNDPTGRVLQVVSLFSASSLSNATIFGLGIMPYISASIIFQLLGSVYPPLEKLQKEGESGRRKITEWTRYATVLICIGQSYFWIKQLSSGSLTGQKLIMTEYDWWLYYMLGTVVMTAGTIFLMWIGEQIDAYGIGNGISLLIMAGILAQMPGAGYDLLQPAFKNGIALGSEMGIDTLLLLTLLFAGVIAWVVFITQGQRRIPIQSQKHVRGRRSAGGQRQSLPLRVNQAGVMPIIFASSLLMFPYFIFNYLQQVFPNIGVLQELNAAFGGQGFIYNLLYVVLIYFFCYFWTAITFNPKDMAENLKDYGSFIPGYRPGARTANHLEAVMVRITYVGAAFLALVAIIPAIISSYLGVPPMAASFYGGTGLLIVVSVVLDLVQKIDSHLVMRNYPGLLDAEN
ncbi:preprotein translocase subunit SecY [Alienimonas californiensis]|uniref:Protein translocase subunit SecY n=1 Tax=Alienimonas californiensis TaxID=2527989 RepID=A0A517P9J6_9PLAN|nr:preprotein translocase subunit SecY [Alienimonas californiensis]QDT16049.1 Protein translocase subunit SecY [Alienimonas californiensis]